MEYGRAAGLVRTLDAVELEVGSGLAGRRIDRLSEKALARLRRHAIGFVFQAFHLLEELTAATAREHALAFESVDGHA